MPAPEPEPISVEGDDLRVPHGAPLPNVCLKCGTTESFVRIQKVLRWAPPSTWAALSLCGVVGLLSMLTSHQRLTLDFALCPPCERRWRAAKLTLATTILGMIAVLLGARALIKEGAVMGTVWFMELLVLLIVVVVFVQPRRLQVKGLDDRAVRLGGVDGATLSAIAAATAAR